MAVLSECARVDGNEGEVRSNGRVVMDGGTIGKDPNQALDRMGSRAAGKILVHDVDAREIFVVPHDDDGDTHEPCDLPLAGTTEPSGQVTRLVMQGRRNPACEGRTTMTTMMLTMMLLLLLMMMMTPMMSQTQVDVTC